MPLFYHHDLPTFGYNSADELDQAVRIVTHTGSEVSKDLYTVTVQNGIQIWTNLISTDDEVYFVQITPYPSAGLGVQCKILLDSRITKDQYWNESEGGWQWHVGYKDVYVPRYLSLESEWPVIQFDVDYTLNLTCRQYAVKLYDTIYKIQPLRYKDIFCEYKVLSFSSHGYVQIDSAEPVIQLYCIYEEYGTILHEDMRRDDYEANLVVYGGETVDIL